MNKFHGSLWCAAGLVLAAASVAWAADECSCAHCGCRTSCEKVCRLVLEEKTVEIVCWGSKEEDFCIPCKSVRGELNCETYCETCGDKAAAGIEVAPKRFVWYDWLPGCGAKVYTRHKLMKGVSKKKIPSFKWVVEDLCPDCTAKCAAPPAMPDVEIPPQPLVAAGTRVIAPAATPRY